MQAALTILLVAIGTGDGRADSAVGFNRDVRPILTEHCFQCHGPDGAARQAGLRLDERAGAIAPRRGGPAIEPGDAAASLLIRRVTARDPDERMPPAETHKRLTADEVEILRAWIDAGAVWERHWSFVPPRAPAPPDVATPAWPRTPIDRFVLARLEREGIRPAPEAGRPSWLRRVTFDLTGLPPSPAEIDAFLADERSDAFERAVDRLLASPRFGERMAVPWLDAARYADSYGYQSDQLSPTWPYRDWVVRAFNANLPYDEFVTWQVAGDRLPEPTGEQRLATAFNRLHRMTNEGGSIEEEWRTEYAADRVHTFGTTLLGLTLECARCHDHKFDPISTREYYALFAFFNSIDEWGMYNDSSRVPTPSLLLPTDAQAAALAQRGAALADARTAVGAAASSRDDAFDAWLASAPDQAPDQVPDQAPDLPGLVGHYPLDDVGEKHVLANVADPAKPGHTAAANTLVPGRVGRALAFTGDDAASFPNVVGAFHPWQAFSVAFWLRVPDGLANAIIFHRSGGTDVGRYGLELVLDDGHLRLGVVRFWPGNAIAIADRDPLPTGRWTHVVATYDASGRAGGLRLYVEGRPAAQHELRDRLTKSPGAGGHGLTFGERFRDAGLEGGAIDDLHVFDRALAPVEAAHLHDGVSLPRALAARDAAALRPYYEAAIDADVSAARAAWAEAVRAYYEVADGVNETMAMEDLPTPRPAYVLPRGAYDAPRTEANRVGRGTPAILGPSPAPRDDAPPDRLALARWLTRPDHPLTARVAVNRLWQQFFGRGLVATSEDFGRQGAAPSHPALLDWLATDFAASGWDVKRLCRLIVTSATYRQASAWRPAIADRDPDNALLARGPSARLSAEMLRDLALAASGLLDDAAGGPPVSPYQPPGLWRESNTMSPGYNQSVGTALYRRSLYTVWKRTAPAPNMIAFDAATREVCTVRRQATSSPVQALVLLNDPQFVEAARVLGEAMVREGGDDDTARCVFGFRRLTGRPPTPHELALLLELEASERARFDGAPDEAARLLAVGERPPDDTLDPAAVAAATIIAQTILNMDATVWKR